MKHYLTLVGDNYFEAIESIVKLQKEGVFDRIFCEYGIIDKKKLVFLASIIIKQNESDIASPFSKDEKGDGAYYVTLDEVSGTLYIYDKPTLKLVDTIDTHLFKKEEETTRKRRVHTTPRNTNTHVIAVNDNNDNDNTSVEETKNEHQVVNIKDFLTEKQKSIINSLKYTIEKQILVCFIKNNNRWMNADNVRREIGLKGSAIDILKKMVEDQLLKSITQDKTVFYNIDLIYQHKGV